MNIQYDYLYIMNGQPKIILTRFAYYYYYSYYFIIIIILNEIVLWVNPPEMANLLEISDYLILSLWPLLQI